MLLDMVSHRYLSYSPPCWIFGPEPNTLNHEGFSKDWSPELIATINEHYLLSNSASPPLEPSNILPDPPTAAELAALRFNAPDSPTGPNFTFPTMYNWGALLRRTALTQGTLSFSTTNSDFFRPTNALTSTFHYPSKIPPSTDLWQPYIPASISQYQAIEPMNDVCHTHNNCMHHPTTPSPTTSNFAPQDTIMSESPELNTSNNNDQEPTNHVRHTQNDCNLIPTTPPPTKSNFTPQDTIMPESPELNTSSGNDQDAAETTSSFSSPLSSIPDSTPSPVMPASPILDNEDIFIRTNNRRIVREEQESTVEQTRTYVCLWNSCNAVVLAADSQQHLITVHKVHGRTANCEWVGCAHKQSQAPVQIRRHYKMHVKDMCPQCGRSFGKSDLLVYNLRFRGCTGVMCNVSEDV
jgi:hypothetical protein